jgi:transcriptional regulator with XRE-family HTH domain
MERTEEMRGGAREIGRRVRAVRRARGWSQSRLAREVEMTEQTIYRVEAGRVWPDTATLERLAAALGCSPLVLLPPSPRSLDRVLAEIKESTTRV